MKPSEIINNTIKQTTIVKPLPKWNPDGEYKGIKALVYDGINIGGKKTKIFSYIGYPYGGEKTPAVLLIHGGGGHPFLPWIKLWVDRGYTALAIETTGHFPKVINAGCYDGDNVNWQYGLCGDFCEESYTNAPDNDGMYTSASGDGEKMWMTHALCACIIGANILRADGRVDPDKIGVTGISWGGVITSLLIGYDPRFAFAVPVYGSGYLHNAYSWIKDNFNSENTVNLWSAHDRFDRVNMPVLWLCWNSDNCFSINSNSESYIQTVKNNSDTLISIKDGMNHGHTLGWTPEESYAFADSAVYGKKKLPRFVTQPRGDCIDCEIDAHEPVSATLYYLTEPLSYTAETRNGIASTYMQQSWIVQSLETDGKTVKGELPENAPSYYIELSAERNGKKLVTTSAYITK